MALGTLGDGHRVMFMNCGSAMGRHATMTCALASSTSTVIFSRKIGIFCCRVTGYSLL